MSGQPRLARERPPLAQTALTWSIIGVGALALTLGTNLFRPTLHGLQLSAEIVQRSREYQRQIRNNNALAQENAYLRTEPGKQWAVRRYTGMVRPGETVGQVVEETAVATPAGTAVERFWEWETRLEAYGTRRWRELVAVLACYGGLRPEDRSPNERNPGKRALSKGGTKVTKSSSEPLPTGASKASQPSKH